MLPEETIRARWIANPCCGYSNRGINPYKILTPIESISRNLFIRDNLIPTFCFHWNPCMNLFVSRKLFSFLKKRERRGRRRKKVVPRYDHANLPCWSLPNLRIIHIEIREEIFSISLWWKHRTIHQFVNRLQTPWFGISSIKTCRNRFSDILSRSFAPFEAGHTSLIIRNNYTARVENVGARGEGESRGLRSGRVCNCASRGCSCREMQFGGRTSAGARTREVKRVWKRRVTLLARNYAACCPLVLCRLMFWKRAPVVFLPHPRKWLW